MRFFIIFMIIGQLSFSARAQEKIFPGADEKTPSKAQYFSWINNTNEGATEKQTLTNLDFFAWLKAEYGMQLDIYAFDAGAIDGKRFYGSVHSKRFQRQFPNGFDSIYLKAKSLGIRLGIWGGPDGFGNTEEEAQARIQQMVNLCKKYHFALFKFDAVCGALKAKHEKYFIRMMEDCRRYSPDLILLNHRLGLKKAEAYATTFLWEGAETYIDVFMTNNTTAPHHRAAAISRGLVPDLKRLTEDHGVCLSSCLDGWDDDLILQAFNRELILAPEIYGNPWLLRDDEFSRLARIFHWHRKYRDILIDGKVLPEEKYGKYAISRGNSHTRLLTLRNLSWETQEYTITFDEEIGIGKNQNLKVFQMHPYEFYFGTFSYGDSQDVRIEPFRAAMFLISDEAPQDIFVKGAEYRIVRELDDKSVLIDIWGMSGTETDIQFSIPCSSVIIAGEEQSTDISNFHISFPGELLRQSPNRKLSEMQICAIPEDAEALYEATVFAADNNALEVRSLFRSGETQIPQVKEVRDAFFRQKTFITRGVWDKNLFDGDRKTGFFPSRKYEIDMRIKGGSFRLDLGKVQAIDSLKIFIPDYFSLLPLLPQEGNFVEVSEDLRDWQRITYIADTTINIAINKHIRYVRFEVQASRIVEIEAYYQGRKINRELWRASNLFAPSKRMKCVKAWNAKIKLDQIPENSYLSIALNGKHGIEGAYVAAKIENEYLGAPDRAVSYNSNTWEYVTAERDANYTYYIPLSEEYKNKEIEIYTLAYDPKNLNFIPVVWLNTPDNGRTKVRVELSLVR